MSLNNIYNINTSYQPNLIYGNTTSNIELFYSYCSRFGKWCTLANTLGHCSITACAYPVQNFPLK